MLNIFFHNLFRVLLISSLFQQQSYGASDSSHNDYEFIQYGIFTSVCNELKKQDHAEAAKQQLQPEEYSLIMGKCGHKESIDSKKPIVIAMLTGILILGGEEAIRRNLVDLPTVANHGKNVAKWLGSFCASNPVACGTTVVSAAASGAATYAYFKGDKTSPSLCAEYFEAWDRSRGTDKKFVQTHWSTIQKASGIVAGEKFSILESCVEELFKFGTPDVKKPAEDHLSYQIEMLQYVCKNLDTPKLRELSGTGTFCERYAVCKIFDQNFDCKTELSFFQEHPKKTFLGGATVTVGVIYMGLPYVAVYLRQRRIMTAATQRYIAKLVGPVVGLTALALSTGTILGYVATRSTHKVSSVDHVDDWQILSDKQLKQATAACKAYYPEYEKAYQLLDPSRGHAFNWAGAVDLANSIMLSVKQDIDKEVQSSE